MKNRWQSDFYAALGLDAKADQESLRRAYLQLALRYHPDRNPGDRSSEERFKLISQAYAVLRDPSTRARYDRMRRSKAGKPKAARPGPARKTKDWRDEHQAPYGTYGSAAAKSQARPSPGARPAPEGKAPGTGSGPGFARPDPSLSDGPHAQTGTQQTQASRTRDRQASGKTNPRVDDVDPEIMADLFKTKEGRDSLNQVEEELKNAGLGQGLDRVMTQLRDSFQGSHLASVKSRAGAFLRNLKSKILAYPAKDPDPTEDIVFGLVLTPEAAASGTTIDISYLRDNQPHRLSVKIPAGIAENARLRLTGQGNLKPAGRRGDLLLDLSIKKT
jgi:curved DNA-binding protein CbpA